MIDARCQALVTFPVTVNLQEGDFGMAASFRLSFACQLLETKLLQLLRFQTGGVSLCLCVQDTLGFGCRVLQIVPGHPACSVRAAQLSVLPGELGVQLTAMLSFLPGDYYSSDPA